MVAPLAAVSLNDLNPPKIQFEGILGGFFGDSLRILWGLDEMELDLVRIFAVFGGFSAAPLAAVSLNHSEGILSRFFGDSLGILLGFSRIWII